MKKEEMLLVNINISKHIVVVDVLLCQPVRFLKVFRWLIQKVTSTGITVQGIYPFQIGHRKQDISKEEEKKAPSGFL